MRYTRFYQMVAVAALLTYAYYLGYRLLFTINPDALTFSLLFFYAEVHGFMALCLYFFQMWRIPERSAPPPREGLEVDVLVPTFNEEVSLLRKTALACRQLRYPHQTWILDDGGRPEVESLAKELGCRYLARQERTGAKAGNLNNALRHTTGELVVVFDADSVPQPEFLEKTLGYFEDPRLALVQVPQQYYNTDSFTFNLDLERKKSWNEHDVFYRLIMPGRDHWDSAFFVGTGAVLRRRALEEVGGFAEGTITEDLHTTLKLYKRGWKGLYHNETLAVGLGAMDLASYHSQHERWGEGNVSILFHDNPIFEKKLSPAQRICFGATVFSWLIGFPKLIYFTAPSVMLLSGWYPIANFANWRFIATYVVYLATIIAAFKIVSRGYGRIFDDEGYNMLNFYSFMKAVARSLLKSLLGRESRFVVTSKKPPAEIRLSLLAPQILLALLSYAAFLWGAMSLYFGVTGDWLGYGVAMYWAAVNGGFAAWVVSRHLSLSSGRRQYRFIDSFPVPYRVAAASGNPGASARCGLGTAANLNETGLSLVSFEPLPLGADIELEMRLPQETLACRGEVLYRAPEGGHNIYQHGIRFKGLSQAQEDAISRYCFNLAWPRFFAAFEKKNSFFTKWAFRYQQRKRFRQRSRRRDYNLPLRVKVLRREQELVAVTRDLSETGLAFLAEERLAVGEALSLAADSPLGPLTLAAEVRRCQPQLKGEGGPFLIGAAFTGFEGEARARLTTLFARYKRI